MNGDTIKAQILNAAYRHLIDKLTDYILDDELLLQDIHDVRGKGVVPAILGQIRVSADAQSVLFVLRISDSQNLYSREPEPGGPFLVLRVHETSMQSLQHLQISVELTNPDVLDILPYGAYYLLKLQRQRRRQMSENIAVSANPDALQGRLNLAIRLKLQEGF